MSIARRVMIGCVAVILAGPGMAADKAYTNTTYADFSAGANGGTRIAADGRVTLAVEAAAVLPAAAINWGTAVSPATNDPNYVWVEAEDILQNNTAFTRCMGNSFGLTLDRWSSKYAMLFYKVGAPFPPMTSTVFNINLPLSGASYYVHVRTEDVSSNYGAWPSAIALYVDGALAATGATSVNGVYDPLRWHALSAPITGGNHTMYITITPNPNQNAMEGGAIDALLFTTDANYLPPNPVPTHGTIDRRFHSLWAEAEDVMSTNASFMRIMANSFGMSTERWSDRYGLLFYGLVDIPPVGVSSTFAVDLPWSGVPYYAHVRIDDVSSDNWAWPSKISLYVDDTLVVTGRSSTVGAPSSLNWQRLSAPIPGGSHTMCITVTPHPSQNWQEAVALDTLLFTTDPTCTPTNPVDTNGKIVGATVSSSGTYTSAVIDTGTNTLMWHQIQWKEDVPTATDLTLQTRTGASDTPDATWSEWSPPYVVNSGEAILSPVNRYLQYRANFTSDFTRTRSPMLNDVVIKADATVSASGTNQYGAYCWWADNTSIPGYTYLLNPTNLAFYNFSLLPSQSMSGFTNIMPRTLALNPNHRFILVLPTWPTNATLLDDFYKPEKKAIVRATWSNQISAAIAVAGTNVYAVTISEEEPGHVWSGITGDSIPAWMTADYQQSFTDETPGHPAFNWAARWSNGFMPWLQGKTRLVFNDVHDWVKTTYPGVKVFQFMVHGEGDYGIQNLGADASGANGYKADGWVLEYGGFGYDFMHNWIEELHQAGIPNDNIYMQVWAFDPYYDPGAVVWQTLQARSLGMQNIYAFYAGAWLPPDTTTCNYVAWDTQDGVADGIISNVNWLYTYNRRVEWENYIGNVRHLSVTLADDSGSGSILLGNSITLSASASGGQGSIARVQFYQNGVLLVTDTTAPYGCTWTPDTLGLYALTAKAYDGYENVQVSTSVMLAVNDVPTNTLTSPANGAAYLRPTTTRIALTNGVGNAIGTITNVSFWANGALLTTGVASSGSAYTNGWTNPAAGRYGVNARAWDEYGAVGSSLTNTILVWTNQDIGAVVKTGSATYTNPTYRILGAGADIEGTTDAFRFVYLPLQGSNYTLTARIAAMSNPNLWAKAGVMVRKSLATNAVNALVAVTPATNNGVTWQYRASDGGSTTHANTTGITTPRWVRLVRTGNTFTAYQSTTNTSWTAIGTTQTLANMGTNACVGLAVSSHTTSMLCTSTFDNVSITIP